MLLCIIILFKGFKTDKWDSNQYKEHYAPQKKGGLDAINNFSFISNKSILDIGYGDEKTTTEIAKKMSK